jgi:hypothetical protein
MWLLGRQHAASRGSMWSKYSGSLLSLRLQGGALRRGLRVRNGGLFDSLQKKLKAVPPDRRGPDALIGAIFDTWLEDWTTLLLTNREVINALDGPEQWVTANHYPRVMDLFRDRMGQYFHRQIDDNAAFALAAIALGVGSMMVIDQRHAMLLDNPSEARERHAYLS